MDQVVFDAALPRPWGDEAAHVEVAFSLLVVVVASYLFLLVAACAASLFPRTGYDSNLSLQEATRAFYLRVVAYSAVGEEVRVLVEAALPSRMQRRVQGHLVVVSHRHGWYRVPSTHHVPHDLPPLLPKDDDL